MKNIFEELSNSLLPMLIKWKGENGINGMYILKATRRGLQLIKADPIMLQLLAQN